MLAYFVKGSILFEKSDYRLAAELSQKSAMGYKDFFGLKHPRVYKSYVLLGDCYNKLGMKEEMIDAYVTAEDIAKIVFGPNSIEVTEIRKKLSV